MKNEKKTIEYINKTKQDALRFLKEAQEDVALWTMVVNGCDTDIKEASNRKPMYGKARLGVMAAIALILLVIALSGCQTAKASLNLGGAVMQDTGWALKKMSDNIQVQEK